MFYCIDCDGYVYEGKTLTEAYRKADREGNVGDLHDLTFIEGTKVTVEFDVVPATQVKAVTKKTGAK